MNALIRAIHYVLYIYSGRAVHKASLVGLDETSPSEDLVKMKVFYI